MVPEFDKRNNLKSDLTLSFKEFKELFAFNSEREKMVENLFSVANKFKNIGCEIIFVFGSFTTSIEEPNDIDVCFDISNIDNKVLEKESSILDMYERKRYWEYFRIDIPFFRIDNNDTKLMKFMKHDRFGNERGILNVNLNDLII